MYTDYVCRQIIKHSKIIRHMTNNINNGGSMEAKIPQKKPDLFEELFGIQQRIQRKISENQTVKKLHLQNGEAIYLILFSVFYSYCYYRTTMIEKALMIEMILTTLIGLYCALIWAKVIIFDIRKKKDFLHILLPELAGFVLTMIVSSNYNMEYLILVYLLVIGARNIDFRRIAVASIIISAAFIIPVTILSLLGVLPDLVWIDGAIRRHSFGFIYCTDYAAHFFFVFCAYFWLRNGKLRWYDIIVFSLAAAYVFWFCRAKTDFICILALLLAGILLKSKTASDHLLRFKWIYILSFAILAAAAIVFTILYFPGNKLIAIMGDKWGTALSRFYISRRMLWEVGLSPFGKTFFEIGNGGVTEYVGVENYTFIDISYIKILLKYGVIAFAAFMTVLTRFMYKRSEAKDIATLIMMFIIAVNCFMAHHLIDFSYNIFILMFFADLSHGEKSEADRLLSDKEEKNKHESKQKRKNRKSIRSSVTR